MSTIYRLDFSTQNLSVKKNAAIHRIKSKTTDSPVQFYSISNDTLGKYEFNREATSWQNKWNKSLGSPDPMKNRIIYFPALENTDNIVMIKTSLGINFYQLQDEDFKLILRSEDHNENYFHDAFGWNEPNNIIKAGHFYRTPTSIGVLTKHQENGWQFYMINRDSLSSQKYPIWPVQTDLSQIGNSSSSDVFLADIGNKGQQNIIIRNREGLNVYEFDDNLDLKLLQKIASGAKSDDTEQNLFFPNLTGQSYRDIVEFNKTGLFVYSYDNLQQNYSVLHYNSLFSEFKGWTNEHVKSVMFEDINSDGFDEMIFTGPKGIDVLCFDRNTNQWLSYLEDDQLTISERYGKIKAVFPAQAMNSPMIFTATDQLYWANITTIENKVEPEEIPTSKQGTSTSSQQQLIPQIVPHQSVAEKPVRLLRDDLDCSSIINSVDKVTGRVNFQLPLIDIKSPFSNDVKVNLFYNGVNQESTTMGIGWSGLPQSYITVDHQSSIYEELESYNIVADSMTTQLKLDPDNSNSTTYSFKPSNNATSGTQIRYYKNQEKWEIKNANITKIYGHSSIASTKDPITWKMGWENWRSIGSSSTGQIKIPTSWYLTEVHDKNKIMKLTYDIIDEKIPGSTNNFTREIYLKSIISQTPTNQNKYEVIFEYTGKDKSEYDTPVVLDKNGFIIQQMITSKFLKGYLVFTPNYQQKINFNYKNTNGKRLLTEIYQENDPSKKPILSFGYQSLLNSYLLEKVTLPSEARIEFNYEAIGEISPVNQQLGDMTLDVAADRKIDYINGDVIISSINAGEITLRTFKQDIIDNNSVSIIHPNLGQKKATTYETMPGLNYFAVVVHYNTSEKELHLFNKPDKTWIKASEFTFSKDTQIKFGKDFILAFERNSLIEIVIWNKDSKTWQKQIFKTDFLLDTSSRLPSQVAISDNSFVVYNNDIFWIAYKDHQQKWHSKKIKDMAGAMNCVKTTVEKFNLENETSKQLLDLLERNTLQMYNNLFLLSRQCLKGSQLYTMLDLFALNKNYEMSKQQQFNIPHEDLSNLEIFRDQKYNTNEGNPPRLVEKTYKLKLGYDTSGSKFKIILKDFPSLILNEIKKSVEDLGSRAPRNVITKEIEKQKSDFKKHMESLFEKDFLLTGSTILQNAPVLNFQTVVIGDKTFTFTGTEWKEEMKKDKQNFMVLGNKYILAKDNENSPIRLYEGVDEKKLDRSLANLGTADFNDVYNAYPTYLAYKEKSTSTSKVIKFTKNGEYNDIISLPSDEQLNPISNQQMLVSSKGNSTLVFRQMIGLNQLLPNPVITKVSSYFNKNNNDKRSIGYEYKSPKSINNAVFYQETTVIPGNDKASFGWTTEEKYFDKPTEAYKIKYFNGQGNLIKTLPPNPESKEANNSTSLEQEKLYSNATIFDVTGKLKVAEFFTNDVLDEEVGYYGFEEYEENQIGSKNQGHKWIFNENNIVKNGFSFTGQNYLKLSRSILHGTFTPKNQDEDYIASCWLRPHNETIIQHSISSILTANIQLKNNGEIYEYTRLGEIKQQVGNWYYVEVLIDFTSAKDILKFNKQPVTSLEPNKQLKASIVISPNHHSNVDIDHIRFSPLNSPFKATVYNINTMQIKDEIRQDGFIKRRIYDKHDKEIASVDEYGQLKQFKTYTKASSIGKIVQLNSITQFEPETGFYESFEPSSFEKRWKIDTLDNWQISPHQLSHLTTKEDNVLLHLIDINPDSFGIRMYLTFDNKHSSFLKFGNSVTLRSNGEIAAFVHLGTRSLMPLISEVIIVVENTRLFVWIDGGLYFDGSVPDSSINSIKVSGEVKINDVMVFNKPNIQILYSNSYQEKLQKIKLERENTAILREYLYDELGRQTINTQPARITRSSDQSLMTYHPNFVTNQNPYSDDSVWKTGQLKGESKDLLGEYGYSQTKYFDNPLNDKKITGLPGQEFSIYGPYAKHFSPFNDNIYISNVYPSNKNYTYQVEYKPGGVKHTSVLDNKKNRVAKFIEISNSKDILSTYEYDSKGNVIKILPPLYHEKAQSFDHIYSSIQKNATVEHNLLEKSLGIFVTYNKNDDILTKETPDSQKIEHIYQDDLLKFTIHYNSDDHPENIMYFDYDEFGRLYERGELINRYSRQELLNLTLTQNNTRVYQQFDYNDFERDPILRRKTKRAITYNEGHPRIEEFTFNTNEKTLNKRVLLPIKYDETPQIMEVNKSYAAGKVMEIEYPVKVQNNPFKLIYKYNKLGQMVSIGVPGNENLFAQFTYNPAGQITNEDNAPNSDKFFTRRYNYNSAGYLTRIQDKFLQEDISYTEKSYGGMGYGDGTVTSTKFDAKWHFFKHCKDEDLKLNKDSFIGPGITSYESEFCFNKLKEAKYLNDDNHQVKVFYPKLNQELPIACTYGVGSYRIQKILGMKGFPSQYGHSYDYGNHQELTKAKYFVGEEMPLPLQPDTFSKEIPTFNSTTSHDIWQKLHASGYIIQNNDKADFSYGHGKPGKSIIRSSLFDDLEKLSPSYRSYEQPLQRIIVSCLAKKQKPAQIKSNLQNSMKKWISFMDKKTIKQVTTDIVNMLEQKSYLVNPFTEEFNNILKNYQSHIPEIVHVLQEHFGSQLGEAEFDVESYDIDANGNHKLFYTGFDRYNLDYKGNSNQISNIKYVSFSSIESFKNFEIKHDHRGNVNQAMHKGIQTIEYHPVSNRPIKIKLVDGRSLLFHYDMQGERILKRVIDSKGDPIYEIHYIRDESGKTLVEKKLTYTLPNLPPDVLITTYIYGPRGLVGFYRHDEFYYVFADHEGSIRLIINGDEVVAAYDYLPYGNIMRKYVNNPESHISYLYTGEEFDEETSLYNLHARFYDPSIGRFYQMDPREQYFSPYKYAGNSPVSMIDPNGEFAWFFAIFKVIAHIVAWVAPVVYGYIGGVKANNNQLNPFKWDFSKASTWKGIAEGAAKGTALGLLVTANPSLLPSAFENVYKAVAAENKSLNPLTWNYNANTLITAADGFAADFENSKKITSDSSGDKLISHTFTQNGLPTDSDVDESKEVLNGLINAVNFNSEIPKTVKSISKMLPGEFENSVDRTISDITGGTKPILHSSNNVNLASKKHQRRSVQQDWGKSAPNEDSSWAEKLINPSYENQTPELVRKRRSITETTQNKIDHQSDRINKTSKIGNQLSTPMKTSLKSRKPKLISSDSIFSSIGQSPLTDLQGETSLGASNMYKALQFVSNFMDQYKDELKNFDENAWNFKHYNETTQELLKTKSMLNKAVWADVSRNEAVGSFSSNKPSDTPLYYYEKKYDHVFLKDNSNHTGNKAANNTDRNLLESDAPSFSTSNIDLFSKKSLVKASTRSTKDICYIAKYQIPELNFSQPIPSHFQVNPIYGCLQCKHTTYEMTNSADFETDKIIQISKRQKMLPPSARNSNITTFQDLIDSNQQSEKKRQKRSIHHQPITHQNEYYSSSSRAFEAGKVDYSAPVEKTDSVTDHGAHTASSWMDWFSWFKNTANTLSNSNQETPNNTSSNPNISQIEAQIDTHGTILLLDLLTRKITGEKFVPSKEKDVSTLEMQGDAISITSEFEDILNEAAVKSGIPPENLTFDPIQVQQIIIDHLRKGKFSKISQTLYSYAKEANSNYWRNDMFMDNLKKQLEKSFNIKKKPKQGQNQQKHQAPIKILDMNGKFMISNTMEPTFLNKSNIMLIN